MKKLCCFVFLFIAFNAGAQHNPIIPKNFSYSGKKWQSALQRFRMQQPIASGCAPAIDTLLFYFPEFPLNATPPADHTVTSILQRIEEKKIENNWTLANDPFEVLQLYAAMTYATLPRGAIGMDDNLLYASLSLGAKLDIVNKQQMSHACGENTLFTQLLIETALGTDSIHTGYLTFGRDSVNYDESKTHTVMLVEYNNITYYFDALHGITVANSEGIPMDFWKAYSFVVQGIDSVRWIPIVEHYGPDFHLVDPLQIGDYAVSLGGINGVDSLRAFINENYTYGVSFDSMWFCARDTATEISLGMYRGNGLELLLNSDPQSASSGQAVLNYIEQLGFEKEITNWWRIGPDSDNEYFQYLLDSIGHLTVTGLTNQSYLSVVANEPVIKAANGRLDVSALDIPLEVIVYDMMGRQINRLKSNNHMNFSLPAKGIYVVVVKTSNKIYKAKVSNF